MRRGFKDAEAVTRPVGRRARRTGSGFAGPVRRTWRWSPGVPPMPRRSLRRRTVRPARWPGVVSAIPSTWWTPRARLWRMAAMRSSRPVRAAVRWSRFASRSRGSHAAADRLLASLRPVDRRKARFAIAAARAFIPHREVGKAAFLRTLEAARRSRGRTTTSGSGSVAASAPSSVARESSIRPTSTRWIRTRSSSASVRTPRGRR